MKIRSYKVTECKTIFTRMQDIKAGKIDEDGFGLNNVESALARINVPLRDSKNSFRDLSTVLEEVAGKWSTLSEVEQANVSKAIAGVRQTQIFATLMQNMNGALELQTVQTESAGLAQERYGIYLGNAEAAQNKLTASWEGMWQATINSDGMVFVMNLASYLLEAMQNAGGLVATLGKLAFPPLIALQSLVDYLEKSKAFWAFIDYVKQGTNAVSSAFNDGPGWVTEESKKQDAIIQDKIAQSKSTDDLLEEMRGTRNASTSATLGEADTSVFLNEQMVAESKKSLDELLKLTMDMIKQQKNAQKDALQDRLNNLKEYTQSVKQYYKDEYDAEKRLRDERKISLKYQIDDIKFVQAKRKENAKKELDELKSIIEAKKNAAKNELEDFEMLISKQEELLNKKKEELAFNNKKRDDLKVLSDLENRIAELAMDDSAEAIAERMRLEAEAEALRQQMADNEAEYEISLEQQMLDEKKLIAQQEYELKLRALEEEERIAQEKHDMTISEIEQKEESAQRMYELELRRIDDEQRAADLAYEQKVRQLDDEYAAKEAMLKDEIALIDDYLKQEGTIRNDAMKLLATDTEATYVKLMEWNKKYGDGLNETIVNMWDKANLALKDYIKTLNELKNDTVLLEALDLGTGGGSNTGPVRQYHSGIDAGLVGGLKSNEVFAKLTKGEGVLTPDQMSNIVNNFAKLSGVIGNRDSTRNNPMSVTIPITVNGSLDKTVLPDLERMVKTVFEKINNSAAIRGNIRSTSLTSI